MKSIASIEVDEDGLRLGAGRICVCLGVDGKGLVELPEGGSTCIGCVWDTGAAPEWITVCAVWEYDAGTEFMFCLVASTMSNKNTWREERKSLCPLGGTGWFLPPLWLLEELILGILRKQKEGWFTFEVFAHPTHW